MEAAGGNLIQEGLEKLEIELDDYFGALTEIQDNSQIKVPQKPEALILYETCRSMGLPLWEGGLMDQPCIWVYEYGICHKKSKFYKKQFKDMARTPSVNPVANSGVLMPPE